MVKENRNKKESILNYNTYIGKQVQVDLVGGRTVKGVLKGFDQVSNLVLDDTVETIQEKERTLGFLFVKGSSVNF